MAPSRTSNVIALSLGKSLTTVVTLVSGMVMARILSQAELATYRQTMLAYDIAVPLLSLGISSGIYYFLPVEKQRVRGVVVDGLVMMVAMGMLYAIFIALGGNHLLARRFSNPAIVNTLVYLVPLPLIMLPAGLLSSVMVVQNQVTRLASYSVLTSLLLASSIIVACLHWRTPEAMIGVRVAVSICIGIAAIVLMLKAVPKDDWRPRLSNMKAMIAFSIPLVLAEAMGTISLQLDKLLVSSMCSPEAFAVYSNGAVEIPLIGIITGSVSNVLVVDFRKAFTAGDYVEALRLYHLVPIKTTLFLFPAMVYLALAAKPFICVLFSAAYAASVAPFMIFLLMIPSRSILLGGMAAVGKNRIVLRNTIIGLVMNILCSMMLVPLLGYLGAAIASVLTVTLWIIPSSLYEICRSLQTSFAKVYPWKTVGRNLVLSGVAAVPAAVALWVLRDTPYLVQLAVSSVVYGLAYLGAIVRAGVLDIKAQAVALRARLRLPL